jgi:hypothetical protein
LGKNNQVQKGVRERRLVESRRVTELEGEIKRLKSISTTQQIDHQIDQSVIERAAKSAVERERLAEAELEQDSPPFIKRRMVPPGWQQDVATDEGEWNQRGCRF